MVRYPSPPSQSWRTLTYKSRRLPGVDRISSWSPRPRSTSCRPSFGFIVLHHERRQIVHFGVTANPTMAWVAQQIREASPVGHGAAVPDPRPGRRIRAIVPLDRDGDGRGRGPLIGATEPVAKSVVERLIGSVRRECLDHSIIAQRAAPCGAFLAHTSTIITVQGPTCRSARTHRMDDPFSRPGPERSFRLPKVGGLHHRYERLRGLTTPARIRSIPLGGNVDAAGIRMPLHRFAGTIRRNKHRDDRARWSIAKSTGSK